MFPRVSRGKAPFCTCCVSERPQNGEAGVLNRRRGEETRSCKIVVQHSIAADSSLTWKSSFLEDDCLTSNVSRRATAADSSQWDAEKSFFWR
ncbi:Hypp8614 [Branchiostoma lanceolatum]|uniref:Hypp8614 protein n=1 Tax=Branchiostoma lanceolatum TaxID=7740 RepID=A0A8J9Z8U7_BRALA|nr:Hypp8614 [Branchiostoma lanceolatum]